MKGPCRLSEQGAQRIYQVGGMLAQRTDTLNADLRSLGGKEVTSNAQLVKYEAALRANTAAWMPCWSK